MNTLPDGTKTMAAWPLAWPNPGAPGNGAIAERMARRAETQARVQHDLLDISRKYVNRWHQRRHESAEAVLGLTRACLQNGVTGHTPAQAWMEWSTGAAERLAEDAADQAEMMQAILRCLNPGEGTAFSGGAAETSKAPARKTSGRAQNMAAAG